MVKKGDEMKQINWRWLFDTSAVALAVMLIFGIGLVGGFLIMEDMSLWIKNVMVVILMASIWMRFVNWLLGAVGQRL